MEGLLNLANGLQVAGLLEGLVLLAFILRRICDRRLLVFPVAYVVAVSAGFLMPLSQRIDMQVPEAVLIVLNATLSGFGYLFILQLLDGQPPRRLHLLVLIPALLVVPGALVTAASKGQMMCWGDVCIIPADFLRVYDVLAGGMLLLALLLVAGRRLEALVGRPMGREKQALVLAIAMMQAALLGLGLVFLSGRIDRAEAEVVDAILRLTFLYLLASSVFRVFQSAFDLPELSGNENQEHAPGLSDEDLKVMDAIRALMTMDKLYQEQGFSRADLARELALPEYQVSRIINAGFGQTFSEMVNGYRLDEARQLLKETEQPVGSIAFDVGFNSLASFNRVFKVGTGQSPTAFRQGIKMESKMETPGKS